MATATNWGGNTVIGILCATVLTAKYVWVMYICFAVVNGLVRHRQLVIFSQALIETRGMGPEELEKKLRGSAKS